MSDFRIVISGDVEKQEEELDWNESEQKWTFSIREYSLGAQWETGLIPSVKQLESLKNFFRIDPKEIKDDRITFLSPAELTIISQNLMTDKSIIAYLCPDCNLHWYIFRKEEEQWFAYGRNCDFSWRKRAKLTDLETIFINKTVNI